MKSLYTSSLPSPKYRAQCPLKIILKRIVILYEATDHGNLFSFFLKLPRIHYIYRASLVSRLRPCEDSKKAIRVHIFSPLDTCGLTTLFST